MKQNARRRKATAPDNRSRTRTKEERYAEVLEGAARVIAAKGYRAASINDIASELGVTAAALYHYVDSKEDLLADICSRAGNKLHEAALEVVALNIPPREKLRLIFERHVELIESSRPVFTIIVQERSELPLERRPELLDGERLYFATILGLLRQLNLPPDIDPRIAAYAMLGMLNWVLRWYNRDGMYSVHEIADQFFRIFADGLEPAQVEPSGKRSTMSTP
jgi:AcrR family transcriptional regulator